LSSGNEPDYYKNSRVLEESMYGQATLSIVLGTKRCFEMDDLKVIVIAVTYNILTNHIGC